MNRREYLDDRLDAMLFHGRLTPPAKMDPQGQTDEVGAFSRALDRLAPSAGWESWWLHFEDALLSLATTRAWPLVGDLERAAARVRDQSGAQAQARSAEEEPEYLYAMVEEWWLKFRGVGPGSVPKEHHAKRLVDARIATWGELRRAGFPIPLWARDKAMAERDPNHERILDSIRATAESLQDGQAPAIGPRHPVHTGLE
jgi:hypothetical protein